jgi:type II secretory pathway pseudopilin PulG
MKSRVSLGIGVFLRSRRGFSYLELLVSVLLLVMAAAGAISTWSITLKAPANKRVTEMAAYVGVRELERLKALKYGQLDDTPVNAPLVRHYDRYGAPSVSQATQGYRAKTWVTTMVNRDGSTNSEDLREIKIEIWDAGETRLYDTVRTLLTFGGL